MLEIVNKKNIKIHFSNMPDADIRMIYPTDTRAMEENKKKYPYILENSFTCQIDYKKKARKKTFKIVFNKGFIWDGASIPDPFWMFVGHPGNGNFLIPSMVHDKLCNNKALVKYDRYLSSLIFKELLLAFGANRFKSGLMFHAVDNYQKLPWNGWKRK